MDRGTIIGIALLALPFVGLVGWFVWAVAKWRLKQNRAKRSRMFRELRNLGYNICDVNSSGTRARLIYIDAASEQRVYQWVDIVELGSGYGLADPINSENPN